jgi:hypothetical protein
MMDKIGNEKKNSSSLTVVEDQPSNSGNFSISKAQNIDMS